MAALILVGFSGNGRNCYLKIGNSAENVRAYFHALKEITPNPMERFVLSLVLASTKTPPSKTAPPEDPATF